MTLLSLSSLKGVAVAFLAAFGHATLVNAGESVRVTVFFYNEFPTQSIDLYWENHSQATRRFVARIPPRGGMYKSDSFVGHEFSYELEDRKRLFVTLPKGNAHGERFIILAGKSESFHVRCEVTSKSQTSVDFLDVHVKPYWAPRGAVHFLDLVRRGHYDGVAFHRVVPNRLAHFGIARDYATRTKEREYTLWDDFPKETKFEPGMLSFTGTGHDSRSTEIFVVMPGAPEDKIETLGENSWEVPFAVIGGNVNESALKHIYSGYGDMPPFGEGPNPSKIYEIDGYTSYLKEEFPRLDYINRCYVVAEKGINYNQSDVADNWSYFCQENRISLPLDNIPIAYSILQQPRKMLSVFDLVSLLAPNREPL